MLLVLLNSFSFFFLSLLKGGEIGEMEFLASFGSVSVYWVFIMKNLGSKSNISFYISSLSSLTAFLSVTYIS